MEIHTLVVEFDGPAPTYGSRDIVLGGRLVAVDFDGNRLAMADEMLAALRRAALALAFASRSNPHLLDDYELVNAAIAKATQ